MKDRHAIAEHVFEALAVGQEVTVAGLGTFAVREYQAYEGRNPRTGERVSVPSKRLPFFKVDAAVRAYVNGSGRRPKPTWVAALIDELDTRPVVLGRLGGLVVRRKAEAVGRDPQGTDVVIPARAVLTFRPSTQLKRKLDGAADVDVVGSSVIDAALARLPAELPRTVAELDAAFASLGLDHARAGLLTPAKRRTPYGSIVVTRDVDDEEEWVLEGTSMIQRTDGELTEVPVATWAAGMLVVGAVRSAANDGVLAAADVDRVLARLGPDSPFGLADLPY